MGFYPVCPGSNEYVIGSPCVKKATINLNNQKTFTMIARQLSKRNIYIQSACLNKKPLNRSYITHKDIINGGELIFKMGPVPNKKWASHRESTPYSMSNNK